MLSRPFISAPAVSADSHRCAQLGQVQHRTETRGDCHVESSALADVDLFLLGAGVGTTASADVITDWNEKATALVTKHRCLPPQAERIIACMHVAMFDAVNSVDRRYQPYGSSIAAPKDASKEAAAAAAAGASCCSCFRQTGTSCALRCRIISRRSRTGRRSLTA